jgi:PAS domain S-box-containing protein
MHRSAENKNSEENISVIPTCASTAISNQDRFFLLSPNILCVAEFSGYLTRVNPAAEKILGFTAAEMTSKPFIDFVHPEDVASTLGQLANLSQGMNTLDFQNRYRCRDGSYKWLSWTASSFDGVLYCAAHDITALKQGEEALRESERWMRTLTESMPQLVFTCRPDGWNTYFNQRWVDYTGLTLEESHGHGWTQVFHPDEQAAGTHATEEGGGYVVESRLRAADGSYRWFLIRGLPLHNSNGDIVSWLGTCTDIEDLKQAEQALNLSREELEKRVAERTDQMVVANQALQLELAERKRTEEALRETQEMLQIVMNHIPQAIFWKDLNSTYLGCNFRLARDAGYDSPSDVVGKSCFDMPWAEHAPGYQADDKLVMQSDTPKLNIEERLTTVEGEVLWLRTNKVPLHNREGDVVGVLGSYEDITEQREAVNALHEAKREAERANEAKSEFLSRMSHELRTPMNAILGFGQLLEMGDLSEQERESVNHILKGGRHLLGLINEILDIAKVESGHNQLSIEPVSLAQAIGESAAMLRPLAVGAGIKVEANLEQLGSLHVLADVQRLKQVLINLLSNGIKYNRPGGELAISCAKSSDGRICIAVRDTGYGMSPEDLEKLFTPFQRLNAANMNIEGSGLGLVLARRLVTAMGGTLSVESTLGVGSVFTIHLPEAAATIDSVGFTPTVDHATRSSAAERIYSVLCIEDNVSNLHLIDRIFAGRKDIHLITAVQGSLGLEIARQHRPDVVLLDLDLPDISGKEVLARLREDDLTKEIPVIMVSADATASQIERLLAAGAQAYVTKPLDVADFVKTVDQILQTGTSLKIAC